MWLIRKGYRTILSTFGGINHFEPLFGALYIIDCYNRHFRFEFRFALDVARVFLFPVGVAASRTSPETAGASSPPLKLKGSATAINRTSIVRRPRARSVLSDPVPFNFR